MYLTTVSTCITVPGMAEEINAIPVARKPNITTVIKKTITYGRVYSIVIPLVLKSLTVSSGQRCPLQAHTQLIVILLTELLF